LIFIINFWIAISFAFSILFSKGVDVVPKTSLIEQLGISATLLKLIIWATAWQQFHHLMVGQKMREAT